MTDREATVIVEKRRDELQIDPEMACESAERAIVAHKENPDEPGPTEDRVAWLVTYACEWGTVTVYVDDASGEVLRVRRSA